MSDCSNSRMEPYTPIIGHIGWGGGHRPTPLSYARYVNGSERVAEYIELDGVRYVPERTCEYTCDYNKGDICTSCGGGHGLVGTWYDRPNYCPNCGARVVSV